MTCRIGLIGFGFIGAQVYERVRQRSVPGLDIAFVHNRNRQRLAGVPEALIVDDLGRIDSLPVDLVVEMAHPSYTRHWGERILSHADYLPLSVTALADDALRERLVRRAASAGTRLLIPHGALVGTEALLEWRHMWEDVEIEFRKSPANIDFTESGFDPTSIRGDTVVYDGPVRGIAARFPRNVNTMVTCALATVGLDRCRARLVACPEQTVAIARISARGRDGSVLNLYKEQPAIGVSGSEMLESQFASILRAAGARDTLAFV